MQYSRPMIELVYEIRRRVKSEQKPGIKMSNPELLAELAQLYGAGADTVTKVLIKELLTMAGSPWIELLHEQNRSVPKQVTKVYRGQTSLEQMPEEKGGKESGKVSKPVRIYRGRVVE